MKICTIASGSSGNATYIEEQKSAVLIDAGLSGKAIVGGLESVNFDCSKLEGVLVTHEHIDHVKGVGIISRKYDLKVYATEETWQAMEKTIGTVSEANRHYVKSGQEFECGNLKIMPFETSHDAANSVGYALEGKKTKVGIATDTGFLTNSARQSIQDADLLVFEANHDLEMLKNGDYPWHLKNRILSDKGHLSNLAAGNCLSSLICGKTKAIVLAHLSQENNSPKQALATVEEMLEKKGALRRDIEITVAPRLRPGQVWNMDEEG